MMFRANSVATGYDTLHVDPLKYLDKSFRGEIFNIDVFTPAPGASVIYRFDTRYDSTSPFGKMKGRPVGLEYLTSVHNSILLSFPLYYLDTADAREFLHFVITEKFDYPVGMPETQPLFGPDLHVYPNPAGEHCTANFNMTTPGHAEIALLSSTGKFLKTCLSMELQAGDYHFEIAIDDLSMGIYFLRFKNSEGTAISKLIKVNSKQ
jgi:hypothetical protein